ncbi:MAG: fatty acid desaturase [Pseudomonadota bacterium]
MSAKNLRQKYMRTFKGMDKYNRLSAWTIFGGYVLQLILAVAAGTLLVDYPISWATVPLTVLLMLVVGTRLRGLNNIIHECCHFTFSDNRADNARIGKLCASIVFSSFSDYRDEHLSHHAHLGDYEHDLDLQNIQDLGLHDPLTPRVVLRHLTVPFLGRHLPYYLGLNFSTRDGWQYTALKIAILVAAVAYTIAFPVAGLLFVILSFALVYSALNYWADCLDHAGLIENGDDLETSRNLLAPGLIRWMFFPRNDCYHLVHHLFPQVPARHLATSHALLMDDEVYRSKPNAVRYPSPVPAVEPEVRAGADKIAAE